MAAVAVAMLASPADPGVSLSTDTAVSLEPTTAGTDLTTEQSGGQAVDVRLNGETIATLDGGGTGSTVFLPSPNDSDGRFVNGPARVTYAALDDHQVEMLTEVMD